MDNGQGSLLVVAGWFNLKGSQAAGFHPRLAATASFFHTGFEVEIEMSTHRRITVVDDGGVSIVRFVDKKIVDSGSIEQLGEEMNSLVTVDKRNMILLNFDGVEFMSSAALNKLISLNTKVKAAAGRLKLCGLRAEIKEVFTITRLDRVFDLRKTEADAVAAFKL